MAELWTQGLQRPRFPRLHGDTSTEVLVIGGGMAGVLCARELHARGVDCLLVEGKTVGSGITKGTTATLSAHQDMLYQDMEARFGTETARNFCRANVEALEKFRALARRYDCDFEEKPHYRYALTPGQANRLQAEAETVRRLGFAAEYRTRTPLPFPVAGAVYLPGMAQFHPLRLLYALAGGLNIRENTPVRDLADGVAFTDRGRILARKIIVATHFPLGRVRGMYFLKLYQRRSYVLALEGGPDVAGTYAGMGKNGVSLRNYGDLLLLSGGGHRTGGGCGWDTVRDFAVRYVPGLRERCTWANQDCVSLDGLPYIGPFGGRLPDLYVATGFHAWGMTTSMVAAALLADQVTGKKNPYAAVFDPGRSVWHPQLLSNLGHALLNVVRPTARRCSHLGCALNWNPAEHSWDCPCHGSRFTGNGAVLDGPATKDIRIEPPRS